MLQTNNFFITTNKQLDKVKIIFKNNIFQRHHNMQDIFKQNYKNIKQNF